MSWRPLITLTLALTLRAQDVINLPDAAAVDAKREALVRHIWPEGFPSGRAPTYAATMPNWRSADWLTMLVPCESLDRVEYAYYNQALLPPNTGTLVNYFVKLTPKHPNGDLFIYHAGHSSGALGEVWWGSNVLKVRPIIFDLLDAGYTVLGFNMPLYNGFPMPAVTTPLGPWAWNAGSPHNDLAKLDARPLRFFLEQIAVGIDWVGAANYHHVFMTGLSGGGWTTTLYSALDRRIAASFPVAGSLPIYLRPGFEGLGDWEQTDSPLYQLVNYEELYVMATFKNRYQLQVLNQFDDCCFWGTRATSYVAQVGWAAQQLSRGRFSFRLDTELHRHWISPGAAQAIINAAKNR
jgi:hypothetical protein